MMEEEKQSEHTEKSAEDGQGPERRISYGLLPQPDMSNEKMRSASIADVQIKSDVKDELANLFS